jgi:hypothetical protein
MKTVYLNAYEGCVRVKCGWTTANKKVIEAARAKLQEETGKAITGLSNVYFENYSNIQQKIEMFGLSVNDLYPYETEV